MFATSGAWAWDTPHHALLMQWALRSLSPHAEQTLRTRVRAPLAAGQERTVVRIRSELDLNPDAPIAPLFPGEEVEVSKIILARTASEPDGWDGKLGMDQDLPESSDPLRERAHMGGPKGATSQGFRHMFFGGWDWRAPLATFQIPLHAIGRAPDRIEKIALLARQLLREKQDLWAWRLIGWATHYIQDLSQPFHSTQIVHWRMIPWGRLFQWPPQAGFASLVRASTHSVSNYHLAYEKYVFSRSQRFEGCLLGRPSPQLIAESPRDLGLRVASESRKIAPRLGKPLISFLGQDLHSPEVDISRNVGVPDFRVLESRPELAQARTEVDERTCEALSWGIAASRALVEWLARTPPR